MVTGASARHAGINAECAELSEPSLRSDFYRDNHESRRANQHAEEPPRKGLWVILKVFSKPAIRPASSGFKIRLFEGELNVFVAL